MISREATEQKRIESDIEVSTFIAKLKYALRDNKVNINFQKNREIDKTRDEKYTNRYTTMNLFPDDKEIDALKRELLKITIDEYVETVRDSRFTNRSDMRVFGRKYNGADVYIKIRVELVNVVSTLGADYVFVMSYHFAEEEFDETDFPHKKK